MAEDHARSDISGHSRTSSSAAKRASAEAARVRLEYAKKETELLKKMAIMEESQRLSEARAIRVKAEWDADYGLLNSEKEAAAMLAEAAFLEDEHYREHKLDLNMPFEDPIERYMGNPSKGMNIMNMDTSKYDVNAPAFVPKSKMSPQMTPPEVSPDKSGLQPYTDILTSFLIRKDVMPKRLQTFNEKPQSYGVWKTTFESVMKELKVNPNEEIDLLVNHLGRESKVWAESLRAATSSDPERGLQLIWARLDEVYGSPERIEASLKNRILNFPQINNKDNHRLYELSDLLLEVQSVKEDPRFATQFAMYDSSTGVNLIIQKLPYSIQQKWVSHASKYKQNHDVIFPPFHILVKFMYDTSKIKNDPAFQIDTNTAVYGADSRPKRFNPSPTTRIVNRMTDVVVPSTMKTKSESGSTNRCPIHKAGHTLRECKTFADKSWEDRRAFLREKGLCFRCIASNDHMASKCPMTVECNKCNRKSHLTVMHRDYSTQQPSPVNTVPEHGGESPEAISSKCTDLCDQDFKGRSCGKIVMVDISCDEQPENVQRVYAILDDQSNRSLISPELCNKLEISGHSTDYTLSSCSGSTVMTGRRVSGLSVLSIDRNEKFRLPTLVECDAIPQKMSEIPTPEVALNFPHLEEITSYLPPLDDNIGIQLLIGRDLPAVHHVKHQILGHKEQPFAVQLPLGWVIIGEVCLGKVHKPDTVNAYFTNIDRDGRNTIFKQCTSNISIKEQAPICDEIFKTTPFDNKVGLSAEDRDFLKIMDDQFTMDSSGQWSAPLPFKYKRPSLSNNRDQALQRAVILKKSLEKNTKKCEHLVTFMDKIFSSGAAEKAFDEDTAETKEEQWYLPLFGIYHPKKPDQIRGVFDSSVVNQGLSLNEVMLSGPNLTNSLLGVLLRFRRDRYAVSADIEQMFYRFLVNTEHRDYLRFFWFDNNKPEYPLTVYRMRVHVFGNRPSPAVATYGLRKAVETADPDVRQFVERDFYVDDGLTSAPSRDVAISLLERTREAFQENGKIRLHKIASNDIEIMNHFPKEDLGKSLKDLDMDDTLPVQQSLGLTWDLNLDMFTFTAPSAERPYTRRGFLSALNSLFDPMGFVAPFTISGKILLRQACPDGTSWDDPLPETYREGWLAWKDGLQQLNGYQVPRMYIPTSLSEADNPQVYVYSDASESAIAVAAYIVSDFNDQTHIGFIMGKAKLAPKDGHSIPRLELCAAVLAIEVATFVSEQLDIPPSSFKYFSDSMVVLGYICNQKRRFYTYVSNRVARIHAHSRPEQWNYVATDLNPADAATRSCLEIAKESLHKWYRGPIYIINNTTTQQEHFPLQSLEIDVEIRTEVVVKTTQLESSADPVLKACERFSSWNAMVSAVAVLIHVVKTYSAKEKIRCSGWHICKESTSPETKRKAELFILSELQKKHYHEEISALKSNKTLPKSSSIISLSPYLDELGMLRVGGRLRKLRENLGIASVNPLIVPKGYIAKLLVRHFHQNTSHQGRHFTEGALRTNGLWIIGAKRLVSSVLHHCVTCRKLRGPLLQQKMADLPKDRLTPGPPFSAVGVDVFGHWEIVTRKTRGGVANSKRWAVMFTCLTTRAVHIEVIEEMSSSCFINALRRFVAIRGSVKIIRSDRGTNFVGAADSIGAHVINVEDHTFRKHLDTNGIVWYFNAPHASHMGGVWERAIGIARRILDGMLLNNNSTRLTHEVLCTFMAEVTAIMNSRPIVAIDTDASDPFVLSPNVLLTQKQGEIPTLSTDMSLKDMYKSHWKHVQVLSDTFWCKWKDAYLSQLQPKRKWQIESPNLKTGDVVLLREKTLHRNDWPMAVVKEAIASDDNLVRKATVRCISDGKMTMYTRPVGEMVLLVNE